MIEWLTGIDDDALRQRLEDGTTFEQVFADAHLNPNASLVTGSVCGVTVQDVEDPLISMPRRPAWALERAAVLGTRLLGD